MRFINLASSSDGNCTFISDGKYNILIDCGISYKTLVERLDKINVSTNDIDAVFITHGHTDHISGLDMFMRNNFKTYIFGDFDTFTYIDKKYPCKYDADRFYNIEQNKVFDLKQILGDDCDIKISSYKSHHDVPCVYYKIFIKNDILSILTDCGHYDDYIIDNLSDVNYLMLESNYDDNLIDDSKYPKILKDRIKSKYGHLSNTDCANIILNIYHNKLYKICLSHISHNSNNEENAYIAVCKYIKNNTNKEIIPNIIVASRVKNTVIVDN